VHVEFWFDPTCPFCWITSRWLVDVTDDRGLEVDWRPLSLLVKNDVQPGRRSHDRAARGHALLRVCESVRADGGGDRVGDLYTRFGLHIHHEDRIDFDVEEDLDAVGVDPDHARALDDRSFDAAIDEAMRDGLSLVGDGVGTPIIAIDGAAGRVALFGPVLTEQPDHETGLRLWDGYVAMAETPGFFELKRTRTHGPDLSSVRLDPQRELGSAHA
jgi:hypothetical protein